jgi:uncharacterized protein
MDWTIYFFMLPVCIVIASVAMFSGISGAALLTPTFLIGFPLFGVPRLTTLAAIATSLFLESSGFGTGLYRYLKLRLVDVKTARSMILVTLPLGALGSIVALFVPVLILKVGYGAAMLGLAYLLLSDKPEPARAGVPVRPVAGGSGAVPRPPLIGGRDQPPPVLIVADSEHVHAPCSRGEHRRIEAAGGRVYDFCAHGLRLQRALSGAGALVAGTISTGVGESTLPALVRRSRFPVPVAAATSTVIVAGTVAGAAATHLVELLREGGARRDPLESARVGRAGLDHRSLRRDAPAGPGERESVAYVLRRPLRGDRARLPAGLHGLRSSLCVEAIMAEPLVVLDGSTFFVSAPSGEVDPGADASRYFYADTRHLSTWRLLADGEPLTASRPQAWSAGAPLLAMRTLLGLDPGETGLLGSPCLTEPLADLCVQGLQFRGGRGDAP